MLEVCPPGSVEREEFSKADLLKLVRSFPEKSRSRVLELIGESSNADGFKKNIYLEAPDLFFAELLSMDDGDLNVHLIQSLARNLICLFESFPEEEDRIDLFICNIFSDLMAQNKLNIARQLALAFNHKVPMSFSGTRFKVEKLFPFSEVA